MACFLAYSSARIKLFSCCILSVATNPDALLCVCVFFCYVFSPICSRSVCGLCKYFKSEIITLGHFSRSRLLDLECFNKVCYVNSANGWVKETVCSKNKLVRKRAYLHASISIGLNSVLFASNRFSCRYFIPIMRARTCSCSQVLSGQIVYTICYTC